MLTRTFKLFAAILTSVLRYKIPLLTVMVLTLALWALAFGPDTALAGTATSSPHCWGC